MSTCQKPQLYIVNWPFQVMKASRGWSCESCGKFWPGTPFWVSQPSSVPSGCSWLLEMVTIDYSDDIGKSNFTIAHLIRYGQQLFCILFGVPKWLIKSFLATAKSPQTNTCLIKSRRSLLVASTSSLWPPDFVWHPVAPVSPEPHSETTARTISFQHVIQDMYL